jgi:hypothetical protein
MRIQASYSREVLMVQLFIVGFTLVTLSSVVCWALVFFTVPSLRTAHPEHFVAAGKPAWMTWTLLNLSFLAYLLSDMLPTLADPPMLAKLKVLRAIWLAGLVGLAIMIVAGVLHFSR